MSLCSQLFILAKTWIQPKCPLTDEWIKKMWYIYMIEYSVQFSCLVVSDFLQPRGLQHARLPCPSPTPIEYNSKILLSPKNETVPFAATWMPGEIIIRSEVRKRKTPRGLIYVWNTAQTNPCTKQQQAHRRKRTDSGCQGEEEEGKGRPEGSGLADANYYI